jgi:TonB family protein
MLTRRVFPALAAVSLAGWLLVAPAPLAAAPQTGPDAPGVTVDAGGAVFMHRTPVAYPLAAQAKKIEGTVIVDAVLDAGGSVTDARAVSGPQELRPPALRAVLDWHFASEAAGSVRQIRIAFQVPPAGSTATLPGHLMMQQELLHYAASLAGRGTIKTITIRGLSEQARTELLGRLPVHEGDAIASDTAPRLVQAVKEFDEHLMVVVGKETGDDVIVNIIVPGIVGHTREPISSAPGEPVREPIRSAATVPHSGTAAQIRVSGAVQQTKLISQPRAVYPELAKQAGIQGVVRMEAVIGADGAVKSLTLMSGHPMLADAAFAAVHQWVYQPTLLNGVPVEVITQIDVNFTLSR